MSEDDSDFGGEPVTEEKPQPRRTPAKHGINGTNGTHAYSREAEEFLLSCVLMDGEDVIPLCLSSRITAESFYLPAHQLIFDHALSLYTRQKPTTIDVVAESLRSGKQLDQAGGWMGLKEISDRIPTTAQAPFFVDQVRDYELRRTFERLSTAIIERGRTEHTPGGFGPILSDAIEQLTRLSSGTEGLPAKGLMSFRVPLPGDKSILLGNRYLNRGDSLILVSTSGSGKSSMAVQLAAHWSLAKPCFGIQPNGALNILYVQAEDSEGDIAEVAASVRDRMGLTADEAEKVNQRVTVLTCRTRRGSRFIVWLRGQIAKHKPDLVILNPLQSFLDGDITQSKDLGDFLREGLNSLNEPPSFGIIVVHHTTKPPADPKDRLWHEVMYDMAGGADLINWARAIISLRPKEEYGKADLVLAKRGKRAGVTKEKPQGAGYATEIVLRIPLKYAEGETNANGVTIPTIFWEQDGEGTSRMAEPKPAAAPAPRPKTLPAMSVLRLYVPKGRAYARNGQVIGRESGGLIAGNKELWACADAGLVSRDESDPSNILYYLKD